MQVAPLVPQACPPEGWRRGRVHRAGRHHWCSEARRAKALFREARLAIARPMQREPSRHVCARPHHRAQRDPPPSAQPPRPSQGPAHRTGFQALTPHQLRHGAFHTHGRAGIIDGLCRRRWRRGGAAMRRMCASPTAASPYSAASARAARISVRSPRRPSVPSSVQS